ncbi:DNA-binding transcriptional repressor DeoR [compost metagenome]
MLSNSTRRILVTDHSKFGKIHKAFVAPLESFDCLITDWEASAEYLEDIRFRGIQVNVAAKPIDQSNGFPLNTPQSTMGKI